MPITKITNLSYEFIPATAGAQQQSVAGAAVTEFMNFTPAPSTKYLHWTLTGGGVRYTIDGSDPSAIDGNVIADGSSGVWNLTYADHVRIIRSGASDGTFDIQELDTRGGY